MTLVMLVLLGLATAHCKLEAVPGLEFLECCCSEEAAPEAPSDCSQDVCGAIEAGAYKAEDQTVSSPPPVLLLAAALPLLDEPRPGVVSGGAPIRPAPPELSQSWPFSLRTASPPRAPSFVS
jgi:hypothetical protein